MNILLIGGTGYIGRLLENLLENGNFKVLNIGRTTDKNYQIGKKIDISLFDNIDIVFYLAWEFNTRLKNYNTMNIESYNDVVNICKKKKIKLYFFSTIYACTKSKSLYNKTKAACEKITITNNYPVVRLGSVIINNQKNRGSSFYQNIYSFVNKYRLFPIIYPNKKAFYKTSEEDFNGFVKSFLDYKNEIYTLAEKKPRTLRNLININDKKIIYIPIPWPILFLVFKICELIIKDFKFRSDSILSIWSE
tara:strand:+ start:246 stop:992 length:747 start_codon:yes stop_codon:yes gene_type:complete